MFSSPGNQLRDTDSLQIEKKTIYIYIHGLWTGHLTFSKQQIFDSPKLKVFADDNFKLDENGRKFYKQVENIVEKGEVAHYEQFLYFPWCFQRVLL